MLPHEASELHKMRQQLPFLSQIGDWQVQVLLLAFSTL